MDHQPVASEQVLEFLVPALERPGVLIDATLGRGGHARAILEAAPAAELIGLDRDAEAVAKSRAYLASEIERVRIVRADFKDLKAVLERLGAPPVRGVLFDLGVSSPQLDDPERAVSFKRTARLDMRMDPTQQLSAYDVVNDYQVADLARIIRSFGEERFAGRIARAIVSHRPVGTTTELAEIVKSAIPAATRRTGGHPARRTFQALRIEVNDELGSLQSALPDAIDVLEPQGRIVAISYHSLEDRIVKRAFADEVGNCTCPPDFPVCRCGARARVRILTRRPARPDLAEIQENARASSAKIRCAERLSEEAA